MTFPERMLAMAVQLGYRVPDRITEHAFRRWAERWVEPSGVKVPAEVVRQTLQLEVARAEIEGIAHKERATIWLLPCAAKIVVSENGNVMTVLPPGAKRTDRRPIKKGGKALPPRRRRR